MFYADLSPYAYWDEGEVVTHLTDGLRFVLRNRRTLAPGTVPPAFPLSAGHPRDTAAVGVLPLRAQGRDHRLAEGSTPPMGTHQADTQLDRLPSATVAGGMFHGPLLRQEAVRIGG